ncbi:restriction endonuclease subunit S [bacterium]|nr:restriction endonuclease subunit S [bacterium]
MDNGQLKKGYKQTEVGEIPEGWETLPINRCTNYVDYRGKTPRKTKDGVVLVTAKNIRFGFIDYSISEEFVSEKEYQTIMRRGYPLKGDVLITTEAPLGNVAEVDKENVALAQRVIKYRANADLLRNDYLKYYLMSDVFQQILGDHSSGSTAKGIKGSILHQLPVGFPKETSEQRLIATALSDIDDLISSLDKLITKKRAIKIATMQQLLTGKKRLPGFGEGKGYKQTEVGEIPEDWDNVPLGDVGCSLIGLTYSPRDVKDYGVLVLRSSNVQNGKLAFEDNVFVEMNLPDRVMVREGDILICVRNGSRQLIGKCALINKHVVGSAFGAFMSLYRSKYSQYIFYQFQSNIIQRQINEVMGATINQLTNKDLSVFKIALPRNESEQSAIASVLSDMDADITALEARRAKTKAIKQGMMQELLTGKTRIIDKYCKEI